MMKTVQMTLLLTTALTILASGASAQTTGATPAADAYGGLEEIVVTARKREERLQDSPVSIVAFSGANLENREITSFKDLANIAPSIDINGGIPNGGGSATQIFIRGVGQDDYSFPNEPGVGLYIDGVYITRSVGGDFGFMDIERVEILRGPQGTLYGKNTIGGAIKIITKKPEGETGGRVEATYGSFDRIDLAAVADFKITDKLFGKLAVTSRNRDGLGTNFIGQDLGNENKQAARLTLRALPTESVEVIFTSEYSKQKQNGPAGSMVQFTPNDATEGLINPVLAPITAERLDLEAPFDTYGAAYVKTLAANGKDVYNSGGTVETRDWAEIFGSSLAVTVETDALTFRSITAYRWADIDIKRDSEHTPFDIVQVDNPETTSQLSQEFQLNGKAFDDRLNFVFGVFGIRERGRSTLYAPLLSGLFDLIGVDLTALAPQVYKGYSLAAFGEATFAVTDAFNITLGARVTHDNKKYTYSFIRPESGVTLFAPTEQQLKYTEFLPKVALDYHINKDVLLYASASKGYKAGGYNSRALGGTPPLSYNPEFLTAYELGLKTTLFDRRMTFNVAGFYNDYKDIQLLSVVDLGDGNVETTIQNAAEGRILGGEIEIQAEPVDDLVFGLGVGILDTKYNDVGAEAQASGILPTNRFINAPKLTMNITADYSFDIANDQTIKLHADANYKSSQFRDAINTPALRADSYWILNGRVAWAPNQTFELAAFVTNITDEVYLTNGVNVGGLGYVEAYYSRPREWGISASAKF